jgi:hypothetical protein
MSYVGNKPAQTTIPVDDSVTTAMLKDDAVTSVKIDDGTITSTDMAVDPRNASNLNAGDVPLAQLGNAPATDLTPLQNDIAILALNSAVQNNQTAHNLSNAFIDQYEDSTGIDGETGTIRDSTGEYVYAAASTSEAYHMNSAGVATLFGGTTPTFSGTNDSRTTMSGASAMNSFSLAQPSGITLPNDGHFTFEHTLVQPADPSTQVRFAVFKNSHTFPSGWAINPTTAGANYAFFSADSAGKKVKNVYDTEAPNVITSYEDTGSGYGAGSTTLIYAGADFISTGKATTLYFAFLAYKDTSTAWIWDTTCTRVYTALGAAGNYTSTTQTAKSTVSKMGIVILYKNESGTATLDTDLVAQVSADGGANYVSAPLTAGGTFSAGILIAESNDITISNTGTTPKFKISFANQASGSKETRVYGAALLY